MINQLTIRLINHIIWLIYSCILNVIIIVHCLTHNNNDQKAVVCNNTSVPTLIINHPTFPHRASTAFKITITLTHRLFTFISEFCCRYSICCRPISDLHLSCILFIFQYKHEEVKPIAMKALVKSKQQGQRKKESIWNYYFLLTHVILLVKAGSSLCALVYVHACYITLSRVLYKTWSLE